MSGSNAFETEKLQNPYNCPTCQLLTHGITVTHGELDHGHRRCFFKLYRKRLALVTWVTYKPSRDYQTSTHVQQPPPCAISRAVADYVATPTTRANNASTYHARAQYQTTCLVHPFAIHMHTPIADAQQLTLQPTRTHMHFTLSTPASAAHPLAATSASHPQAYPLPPFPYCCTPRPPPAVPPPSPYLNKPPSVPNDGSRINLSKSKSEPPRCSDPPGPCDEPRASYPLPTPILPPTPPSIPLISPGGVTGGG